MTEVFERCGRCGRRISEPLSLYVGMGPVCREASGLVEARGWRAVEQLGWWREDGEGCAPLVWKLDAALRWWKGRLVLLDENSVPLMDQALDVVDDLLRRTRSTDGRALMGLLWKLVGHLRFGLEPTLRTLQEAGVVQHRWIEGVPELVDLMPSIQALLCGIRAPEDAVELAMIRARDQAKLMSNEPVLPEEGLE